MRYINQHSLLTNDKYLERLSIFINFTESCPAVRTATLSTGNEYTLYIPISVPRGKSHHHIVIVK